MLIAEADRQHDFGVVVSRPGRIEPHSYRLVNTTVNVVNLRSVVNHRTCCASVRAEKFRLEPGESADIEVSLRLDDRFGEVVNETEVVTDLPSDERITLRTSATAVANLRVEPLSLPDGPIVAGAGSSPRAAFRVFAAGDASEPPVDLDRLELRSTIPVAWEGAKRDGPSEEGLTIHSRDFQATLDATGASGARRAEVVMGAGANALLRHVVAWNVVAPIAVAPEMIVLKSGAHDYRVVLKSRDQTPFRVTEVACEDSRVRGRATSAETALTQVVELKADPKPGAGNGVVSVFTDHPTLGRIEVPFIVLD